jgi:alpha-glucosidase (family GH31 glycosyl hydrolase)
MYQMDADGCFSSLFQDVTASGDHGDQEPWSFGEEALDIVRKLYRIKVSVAAIHLYLFLSVCV